MPSDSRSNSCLRFSTMLANLGSRIRRMLSRQVETSSSEESVTEELIADHQSTDSDEFQIDSSETGEVSEIDADDEEDIETNQSPSVNYIFFIITSNPTCFLLFFFSRVN